jgi:hypothetical protein
MPNTERNTAFLADFAETILAAGNDRLADAIYAALESYGRGTAPAISSEGNAATLNFPGQANAGQ